MTSYDGPGRDNDTTYIYDVGLKRIKKDVDGTVTKFVYAGWDCAHIRVDTRNTLIARPKT